jgi:cytoskeletal protein CcmA (bactofilin family)
MNHIDELTYLRYLDGQLGSNRAGEVETHTRDCFACSKMFEALKHETAQLRSALVEADEPLPERFESARTEELSWAWLSVLGLAGFGLYMLWEWVLVPWWEGLQSVGVGQQTFVSVLLFRGLLWEGWSTMAERAVQGLILIILTATLATLVHWGSRLRRTWTRLMVAIAVVLVLPFTAGAAVIETDRENYVLPEGEVIPNDLIVVAETVRIEGTIEGDLIAAAQSVTVTGRVGGDILVAAQKLNVDGRVDGNVRAAAEFHDLSGFIARNVTVFGESVELRPNAEVEGSFTSASEKSSLEGRVGRDLITLAARSQVNGRIGGSARLAGGLLTIGPDAEIAGEVKLYSGEEPKVSPEASLASPPEVEIFEETPKYASPETYLWPIVSWAAAFVFGLVMFLLMPGFFAGVLRGLPRYGVSIGIGAAALVAIPVVAIVVCFTLVGLPVGLLALVLYVAAVYSAQIFVGAWLGQELLGEPSGQADAIGRLALGLALIHVVGLVPYVGKLAGLAVCLWGLGALALYFVQPQPAETAAA